MVHDGGADHARVHAALDEIAGDAAGDAGGPERDMYAPSDAGVDAMSSLDAALVSFDEFWILAELIAVQREQPVFGVVFFTVERDVAAIADPLIDRLAQALFEHQNPAHFRRAGHCCANAIEEMPI